MGHRVNQSSLRNEMSFINPSPTTPKKTTRDLATERNDPSKVLAKQKSHLEKCQFFFKGEVAPPDGRVTELAELPLMGRMRAGVEEIFTHFKFDEIF